MRFASDPAVFPLGLLSGLALVTLALSALSFLGVLRARAVVRQSEERAKTDQARIDALLASLQETQNRVTTELREIRQEPQVAIVPGAPKAGLNLTKRSHALRMHRHGETPDRIAAALDLPRQEVDLLLKVHRIVINSM